MGFTSVLKKVGLAAMQISSKGIPAIEGVQMVAGIVSPMLHTFLPPSVQDKVVPAEKFIGDLGNVENIIKDVEAISAVSGVGSINKFNVVTSLTATAFSDFMSAAGHEIADKELYAKAQAEFKNGIAQLVQAKVDMLNSLKAKD